MRLQRQLLSGKGRTMSCLVELEKLRDMGDMKRGHPKERATGDRKERAIEAARKVWRMHYAVRTMGGNRNDKVK